MSDTLNAGDRTRVHFTDGSAQTLDATICSALSDREEGIGPEIGDYVACWLEISTDGGDEKLGRLAITLRASSLVTYIRFQAVQV